AEELLERLLKRTPRKASILHRVAQAYAMIERPERAAECYRQCLALNRDTPSRLLALLELAQLYERSRKIDDARAVLDEVLTRDPGNEDGRLQLAILNRSGAAGDAEEGLRSLAADGAVRPHVRAQAWYELAQLLDGQERYDEAFR